MSEIHKMYIISKNEIHARRQNVNNKDMYDISEYKSLFQFQLYKVSFACTIAKLKSEIYII